jgi:curved DNA-binding protein
MTDPYSILGVSKSASDEEIKQAYRKLAKEHHPDRGGDSQKFAEISSAYDSIKNHESRDTFNRQSSNEDYFSGFHRNSPYGNNPFGPGGLFDFESIFSQQFNQTAKNNNVTVTVHVSIEDIINNANKNIDIRLPNGTTRQVTIKIPSGVTEGSKIKYQGFGDNSNQNLPPGDLIVLYKIKNDNRFTINEYDVTMTLDIALGEAMLGTEKTITTPDNKKLKLKIRPGTQSGTKLRIPESGLPDRNRRNGNLYIELKVKIPQINENDLDSTLREIIFKS